MSPTPTPTYNPEPCFRCRRLAEMPLHAEGRAGGEALDNAPLCGDCLAVCINDPAAFWAPLRRRRDERRAER